MYLNNKALVSSFLLWASTLMQIWIQDFEKQMDSFIQMFFLDISNFFIGNV